MSKAPVETIDEMIAKLTDMFEEANELGAVNASRSLDKAIEALRLARDNIKPLETSQHKDN